MVKERLEKGDYVGEKVYKSKWKRQPVVVKRIRGWRRADFEIERYIKSIGQKNIISMHHHFEDNDKFTLVLERGLCSLRELMNHYSFNRDPDYMPRSKYSFLKNCTKGRELGESRNLSPNLLRIIRNILSALESLHQRTIKHGYLDPDNVIICEGYKAKLAMTKNQRSLILPNVDVDFLGAAQIVHYCATLGHSTGYVNGAVTVSPDLSPDICNLILYLFNGPGHRPDRFYINHFTFWNHVKKIQFLCAASSKLCRASGAEITFLQRDQATLHNGNIDWKVAINNSMPGLWNAVNVTQGMNSCKTAHLVRFIRNAYQHCDKLPIRSLIGDTPTSIVTFFDSVFPLLLARVYDLAVSAWGSDEVFESFMRGDGDS
ncbi:serine/threonine-protein kinase/endoribonuclease IRE1a [Trifolium repens]|nr:serine/threonine-protein kinase/endoribonuclease IRE1a [Trifolium repens]